MLHLKENPTLKEYQQYIHNMEIQRNFISQNTLQKCLMLGEEIGELFKAIRKEQNLLIDKNSSIGSIEEEIADIFIFLLSIANRYNIDLEKAFRDKEEINKKRVWNKTNNTNKTKCNKTN